MKRLYWLFLLLQMLPGIQQLLTSNEPPSEEEFTAISNARRVQEDDIAKIQAQMRQLHSALVYRICASQKFRSVLSSWRRAPPEVLTKIFLYCCPPETMSFVPLVLCAVSRGWRAVALSTPSLWTIFIIR